MTKYHSVMNLPFKWAVFIPMVLVTCVTGSSAKGNEFPPLQETGWVIVQLIRSFQIPLEYEHFESFLSTNKYFHQELVKIREKSALTTRWLEERTAERRFEVNYDISSIFRMVLFQKKWPKIMWHLPFALNDHLDYMKSLGEVLSEMTGPSRVRSHYLSVIYRYIMAHRELCLAMSISEGRESLQSMRALLNHKFPGQDRSALCILFNSQSKRIAALLGRLKVYEAIQTSFGYFDPDDVVLDEVFSLESMIKIWHLTRMSYKLKDYICDTGSGHVSSDHSPLDSPSCRNNLN